MILSSIKCVKIYPGHLGLYTIRNVDRYEILSFYNGFRFVGKQEKDVFNEKCQKDPKALGLLEKPCIEYQLRSITGEFLNISPKSINLNLYNATFAHMANHRDGKFSNANFGFLEHPRFGPILCIFATKSINANEEIFVDYRYDKIKNFLLH